VWWVVQWIYGRIACVGNPFFHLFFSNGFFKYGYVTLVFLISLYFFLIFLLSSPTFLKQSSAMAAYAGTQLMAVQVPQGCYAGQLLQIQAPNGQLMQVQIPQGIGPGQQFQVRLPTSIEIPEIPQPSHQQPQQQQQQGNVQQLFQAVDTDHSGQIDVGELQRALSSGGYHQFQVRTASLLIRMFDQNRSQTIGFSEFQGLWNYLTQWKQSFDQFDQDRSGSIDHQEL
jgi:Ca2+-binding EF-hand superfamily protein